MCARIYHDALRCAVACVALLAAIVALPVSPAQAGGVHTTDCIGGYGGSHSFGYRRSFGGAFETYNGYPYGGGNGSGYHNGYGSGSGNSSGSGYGANSCVEIQRDGLENPYVIQVPPPRSEQERGEIANRDRLWQARCRPVIRQDAQGVQRYSYAAPGCEYGKYE